MTPTPTLAGAAAPANLPAEQPPAPDVSAKPYRIGTLAYNKRDLFVLFFWLIVGDVLFMIIDQIEPKVLPIFLKLHGATDQQIAIIVGSFAAAISLCVNPIVSYRSDRKRSPHGRRIPYLRWATPFVGLFLAITPFAPELAHAAMQVEWIAWLMGKLPWAPVVAMFALLVVLYQVFEKIIASVYFYLFRDVVPPTHLGRFLTLFRVFGALAVFVLNYWIVGLAETHPHQIFIGVAVLYVVGFFAMCRFVKEGEYPPVEEEKPTATAVARFAPLRVAWTFVRESYRSPLYWWTYFTRTMFYSSITVMSFVLFFARDELGLSYDQAGKLMSWSSFAWLVIAYPMGRLLDRWGGVRTLNLSLWLLAVTYAASFFGIVGEKTFLAFSVANGIGYWMVMLSSIMLVQQIYHPMRMGQLSAANVIFQSVIIAFIVSPATGWILDTLKGLNATLALPLAGNVTVGSYRFVYLILAALCFAALFGLQRVRVHWLRHGGPDNFQPPSPTHA